MFFALNLNTEFTLELSNGHVYVQICAVELPRANARHLRLQRRSGPGALPADVPRHRPPGHYETRSIHLCRVGHGKRDLSIMRK